MAYKPTESPHTNIRRFSQIYTLLLVAFSFLTLILSAVYGRILYTAPRDKNPNLRTDDLIYKNRVGPAWYIFVYPFLPIISILQGLFELLCLRAKAWQKPWQCGVRALMTWLFLCAWVFIIFWWWVCDFGFWGPQMEVVYPRKDGWADVDEFTDRNYGLTCVKMAFGTVVTTMYFFYIPFAAFAFQKARTLKKMAATGYWERKTEDLELEAMPRQA